MAHHKLNFTKSLLKRSNQVGNFRTFVIVYVCIATVKKNYKVFILSKDFVQITSFCNPNRPISTSDSVNPPSVLSAFARGVPVADTETAFCSVDTQTHFG